jgi:hypothetical protein
MRRNCLVKSICRCSKLTSHQHSYFLLIGRTALNPILFSQVPALDTVLIKLSSFIHAVTSWPSLGSSSKDQVKQVLSGTVIPYLKSGFAPVTQQKKLPSVSGDPHAMGTGNVCACSQASPASLFPLVDLWRSALLDPAVGTWISPSSSSPSSSDPIKAFIDKFSQDPTAAQQRNYTLTLLRLLSNVFSSPTLSRQLFTVRKGA